MLEYNREIKHSILRTTKKFYIHTYTHTHPLTLTPIDCTVNEKESVHHRAKDRNYALHHSYFCAFHVCCVLIFSIRFWIAIVLPFTLRSRFCLVFVLFLSCLVHSGKLNNLQCFGFFFCDFLSHLQYICTNLYTVYIIILKISHFYNLNFAYK